MTIEEFNTKKRRDFMFLLYEESMTRDALEYLEKNSYPVIISPWHDRDKHDDGSIKKKHRHCMWTGKTCMSPASIRSIMQFTGGVLCPQEIYDKDAMIRYFIHEDNPEKVQYDINDMICYGGTESRMQQAFQNKQKTQQKANPYLINNTMFLTKFREVNTERKCCDFSEFIFHVLDNVNDTLFLDACMAKHTIVVRLLQANYYQMQREQAATNREVIEKEVDIQREIRKQAMVRKVSVGKIYEEMLNEMNEDVLNPKPVLPPVERKTEN